MAAQSDSYQQKVVIWWLLRPGNLEKNSFFRILHVDSRVFIYKWHPPLSSIKYTWTEVSEADHRSASEKLDQQPLYRGYLKRSSKTSSVARNRRPYPADRQDINFSDQLQRHISYGQSLTPKGKTLSRLSLIISHSVCLSFCVFDYLYECLYNFLYICLSFCVSDCLTLCT